MGSEFYFISLKATVSNEVVDGPVTSPSGRQHFINKSPEHQAVEIRLGLGR